MKEYWKALVHPDIADGYSVSTAGRIRFKDSEPFKPGYRSSNGYEYVKLLTKFGDSYWQLNLRYFPIDELIAQTFVEFPKELEGKPIKIKHLDGNKLNSNADNLCWEEDIEEWRIIPGFEDYMISNHGHVKSMLNNIILTTGLNSSGYLRVSLNQHKKRSVHRLYMMAFHPVPNMDKLQVNHIDEIKTHNSDKNLEWVTVNDNQNFGVKKNKTSKDKSKAVMCVETGIIYRSATEAAKITGAQRTNITECCNGHPEWTTGGYHWRFA